MQVIKGMLLSLHRVLTRPFLLFLMPGTPIRGSPLHLILQQGELVWALVTRRGEEVLLLFLRVLFGNLVPHQIQGILFRMLEPIPSRMESSGSASLTFSGNVKLAISVEVD